MSFQTMYENEAIELSKTCSSSLRFIPRDPKKTDYYGIAPATDFYISFRRSYFDYLQKQGILQYDGPQYDLANYMIDYFRIGLNTVVLARYIPSDLLFVALCKRNLKLDEENMKQAGHILGGRLAKSIVSHWQLAK